MVQQILGWMRSITEMGLALIALGVVLQVLFGSAVPFLGLDVVGSVVGLVKQLGTRLVKRRLGIMGIYNKPSA